MKNVSIILAAGKNTRISELCYDSPKGLLGINGQSLLERLCLFLEKFSDKIIIVAGHNKKTINQILKQKFPSVEIIGKSNEFYISNSESLLRGLNSILDAVGSITIVEADIILSNKAMDLFLNETSQKKMLIIDQDINENDDKLYYNSKNDNFFLTKENINKLKSFDVKTIGKFLGLFTISYEDSIELMHQIKNSISQPYIYSLQTLLNASYKVIKVTREHADEIDDYLDYSRVLKNTNFSIMKNNNVEDKNLYLERPLQVYIGVYDILGAQLAQRYGFDGLWLGSYQICLSNGLEDDETYNPLVALKLAKNLRKTLVDLPIIIDIGSGFKNQHDLERFSNEVHKTNIVAICVDDNRLLRVNSMFECSNRKILSIKEFGQRINQLRNSLPEDIKIIARTEFLTINKEKTNIRNLNCRIQMLENMNVDAILPHYVGKDFDFIIKILNEIKCNTPLILIPSRLLDVAKIEFSKNNIKLLIYANIDIRNRVRGISELYLELSCKGKINKDIQQFLSTPEEIAEIINSINNEY